MSQYAFSFNLSRCSGCMVCVVACRNQNDFADGDVVAFRHVTRYEGGRYPAARIFHFSLSCQHCGDAPCVTICPTGAIFREQEDGAVLVRDDLCVGCHSCELACPFGAPKFPEDGKMATGTAGMPNEGRQRATESTFAARLRERRIDSSCLRMQVSGASTCSL